MIHLRALSRPLFASLLLAPLPATAQDNGENISETSRGSNPVTIIAALNKREGSTADFTLKPGEQFSFGTLTGTLRSCETTAPHEVKQSAAFLQISEQPPATRRQTATKARTVFSGWLFAESPSLNPFIHPVYDVWLRSCTMDFPDGPAAPGRASATGASTDRSADD